MSRTLGCVCCLADLNEQDRFYEMDVNVYGNSSGVKDNCSDYFREKYGFFVTFKLNKGYKTSSTPLADELTDSIAFYYKLVA